MKNILRASAMMGSSSVVTILTGIIRNKVFSILVGPAGIGLMGMFGSIQGTASTLFGLGINSSGVRQIAAAKSADPLLFEQTHKALLRSAFVLGILGALAVILLREQIATRVFGNNEYAGWVGWLGIGVFASLMFGAQFALINGLRRIKDLAKISILGSIVGMLVSILIIFIWRKLGLLIVVVIGPFVSFLFSSWFSRKIKVENITVPWRQYFQISWGLFSLGAAFMLSDLMSVGSQFILRAIILQKLNIESVGHFLAAWSISMQYIGFVLTSMAVDYYPRLAQIINDHNKVNLIVNETTEVVLLLAVPVILCMLTFAPQVVHLLYSSNFDLTIDVLRWQVMGDILKIAAWPLGFIIVAKAQGRLFVFTELFWYIVYFAIVWLGLNIWGIKATGIAFLISYISYYVLLFILAIYFYGYRVSVRNLSLLAVSFSAAVVIKLSQYFSPLAAIFIGCLFIIIFSAYSFRRIATSINLLDIVKKRFGAKSGINS